MSAIPKEQHRTYQSSDVAENWNDIVQEANEAGEVVVADAGVVIVPAEAFAELKQAWREQGLAKWRADIARQLACLKEPDAGEKLRKIFASTPEEIAASANAEVIRNRG